MEPHIIEHHLDMLSEEERYHKLLSLPGEHLYSLCEDPRFYRFCDEYLWKHKLLREGIYERYPGESYRETYYRMMQGGPPYRPVQYDWKDRRGCQDRKDRQGQRNSK